MNFDGLAATEILSYLGPTASSVLVVVLFLNYMKKYSETISSIINKNSEIIHENTKVLGRVLEITRHRIDD